MLYAVIEPVKDTTYELKWHIGEDLVRLEPPKYEHKPRCLLLQADSDELALILGRFSNIPQNTKRVQVWTGDFADFIYRNL